MGMLYLSTMDTLVSIAVLPFRIPGGEKSDFILAEGLVEELINGLSQIPLLRVLARSSSFSFRESEMAAQAIGAELGVDYVLEGSLFRIAEAVRISCQLVEVRTGYIAQSFRVDRSPDAVLLVPGQLASLIAGHFQLHFSTGDSFSSLKQHPAGEKAYLWYLRGRFALGQNTIEEYQNARSCFEKALHEVPEFPEALALLSTSLDRLVSRGRIPLVEGRTRARESALKAVALSPEGVEPLLALAEAHLHAWDWDAAQQVLTSAVRNFPGHARVRRVHARYLDCTLQWELAMSELHLAQRLDPVSVDLEQAIATIHVYAGNLTAGLELVNGILAAQADYRPALYIKGWCHILRNQLAEALEVFLKIEELVPLDRKGTSSLACIYALLGEKEKALKILDGLHQRQQREPEHDLSMDFVFLYHCLGQPETALEYLEKACDRRNSFLPFSYRSPYLKGLWKHPDFQRIHERSGLPSHIRQFKGQGDVPVLEIKCDTREVVRIPRDQLVYAQADDNYVQVFWLAEGKWHSRLLRLTLKSLSEQLSPKDFLRIHKSFLVNLHHPWSLSGNSRQAFLVLEALDKKLSVSRSAYPLVREKFS